LFKEESPLPVSPVAANIRVLIIDDEYLIAKSISELLHYLGYIAEFEQNPLRVEAYLANNPSLDIVLLDINLGHSMSGIELLSLIKGKNKYIQVIMFTSEDKLEIGLECMRRGAYDFMTKPFDEQIFVAKASGAIERKKTLQLNDLYLGILFHDLKNPLQGITGGIELLRMSLQEASLSDLQRTGFSQAERGMDQILMMINNIVSVSKFENGTACAQHDSFLLHTAVEDALALFLDPAGSTSDIPIEITYHCNRELAVVTDQDMFGRVLINIVSNALRFAEDNSTVRVELSETDGSYVETRITNTGSFIEESAREVIFNKFSSVQVASSQAGFKNFGLGLTFAKMAVEAMEGRIWITCDGAVPSTTFHYAVKNFTS
jgi:K+-sensing histidine kinase KdpD